MVPVRDRSLFVAWVGEGEWGSGRRENFWGDHTVFKRTERVGISHN